MNTITPDKPENARLDLVLTVSTVVKRLLWRLHK